MGSIYQRGPKFWIRYTDPKISKLIRRSAGTTRLEAVKALREAVGVQEQGRGISVGPPLEALVDSYRDYLRIHAKGSTRRQSESCFGKLLDSFGEKDAASLTLQDLDGFIEQRRADGVKPRTINSALIILRSILNHALRVGLLEKVPINVRLLRAPKKRVLPILSADEIRRLIEAARDPYYGILLISAH